MIDPPAGPLINGELAPVPAGQSRGVLQGRVQRRDRDRLLRAGGDVTEVPLVAEAPDAGAGAGAEVALDEGAGEARRGFAERVRGRAPRPCRSVGLQGDHALAMQTFLSQRPT